jgi:hypothetical protein
MLCLRKHGLESWIAQLPDPPSCKQNIVEPRPSDGAQEQHRFNWGDYMTLNYAWDDHSSAHAILVNGAPCSLTVNLYQALTALRDSDEIREQRLHVWADAVCIMVSSSRRWLCGTSCP